MNHLFQKYKQIADNLIPSLKNNNFIKTGLLTEDEFIKAGDYLVSNYNEWTWNKQMSKKLPFLIFKNIQYKNMNDFIINDNDNEDDEWNIYNNNNNKPNKTNTTNTTTPIKKTEIKNINLDLTEFEELIDSDDSVTISNSEYLTNYSKKIYDITITYDNYYRTPRIWFHAYNFYNEPISNETILEDFSIEHTKVSVTIDTHPYYQLQSVSVHPCKHADAMKKLIKIELESNKEITVEQYFIYFLKFVSCIFPNIIFDFTKQ